MAKKTESTDGLTTVAEFNIGAGNRARFLQWDEIARCMASEEVGILGLTEASNKKKTAALTHKLGEQAVNGPDDTEGRYALIMDEIASREYAALIYDTTRYRSFEDAKYYVSRTYKYLWCELEDVSDGRRVDVVVVHLPFKKPLPERAAKIKTALESSTTETLCIGDFNLSPNLLCKAFESISLHDTPLSRSQVAFANEKTAPITTKSGNTYDNMMAIPLLSKNHRPRSLKSTSLLLPFDNPGTFNSMLGSDHYPIIAEWSPSSTRL